MSAETRPYGDHAVAVLYNDECPVCRFEVDHYRTASARAKVGTQFAPIRDAVGWDMTEDAAARRLHVRTEDGRIVSGLDAFLAIWRTLPGWRWAARIAGLPGLRGPLSVLYDRVGGPLLYAMHRRRRARRSSPSSTNSMPPSSR